MKIIKTTKAFGEWLAISIAPTAVIVPSVVILLEYGILHSIVYTVVSTAVLFMFAEKVLRGEIQ